MQTILLLTASNVFMTFAWYGHLKTLNDKPLWIAILVSWGIAFFEYVLQVPANRIGYTIFTLGQLKIIQEIITICVFAVFAWGYMGKPLTWNYAWAGLCMVGAAFFIFRDAA
ncbi:MAG: DMT family protein [Hyphomicrobiales bacterium]